MEKTVDSLPEIEKRGVGRKNIEFVASEIDNLSGAMARFSVAPTPDATLRLRNALFEADLENEIAKALSRVEVVDPHFQNLDISTQEGLTNATALTLAKAKVLEKEVDPRERKNLQKFTDKILDKTSKVLWKVGGKKAVLVIPLIATACGSILAPEVPTPVPSATLPVATEVSPSLTETPPSFGEVGQELNEAQIILKEIEARFGIFIPPSASEKYSQEGVFINEEGEKVLFSVEPNVALTAEEAKLVFESLEMIPNPGYLVQLMIPFRYDNEKTIAGGVYLSYQWPAYLRPMKFDPFPRNSFVSDRAAMKLILPNKALEEFLPQVSDDYSNVVLTPPLQASMNSAGVKAKTESEIPWTIHGERLKQAIVHETGHALIDKVRIAISNDMEDYWQRSNFTIYNMNTWDIDNPLLVSFAKVNGWQLVPYIDFVRQYSSDYANKLTEEKPKFLDKVIWDRDFTIWGDLANRQMRITPYASYGPIQEAFCEYWMTSILYPDFLTDSEKKYFQRIQEGLRSNPEAFIQSIVEDPDILLAED